MLIHSFKDPLKDWMHLERYVNDGSDHQFKNQTEVPLEYRPSSSNHTIPIYHLEGSFTKSENVLPEGLYPVHPHTAALYERSGHRLHLTDFQGIPTSSTRTVLISRDNFVTSFLVKLDLPILISRFNRSVSKSDILFSEQINSELLSLQLPFKKFTGTFLEIGGGSTILNDNRDAGYILRNLDPHWFGEKLTEPYFLIPSFSLISTDTRHPNDDPIVVQIARMSISPVIVIFQDIIVPLLDYWFSLAERGIIWELQQQNTLFILNSNRKAVGVVSRDYDGVYIDTPLRESLGLSTNFVKHKLDSLEDRSKRYSLIFDHRVCKQNIVRIIQCVNQNFGNTASTRLKELVVDYIHLNMPSHMRELLPENAWYTCPEVMFFEGITTSLEPTPPLRYY